MKNKTKLKIVNWPAKEMFMMDDIFNMYPTIKKITLRVHFQSAITDDGLFSEIGSIPCDKGRPKKVFTRTPVTKEILDKAESQGINLVDNARERFGNVPPVSKIPLTPTPIFKPLSSVNV